MRFAKDEKGEYPGFAWPGGYPVYYVTQDGGALCRKCVNDKSNPVHKGAHCSESYCAEADSQWCLIDGQENWEDPALFCDHCGERIESAYAEDDVDKEA